MKGEIGIGVATGVGAALGLLVTGGSQEEALLAATMAFITYILVTIVTQRMY